MNYYRASVVYLLAFLLLSACGYYSFKGALPSHVQSVAVPLFEDRSTYPGLRERLTEVVINGFVEDNTLKVVDESKADLVITGTIQQPRQQAATVSQNELVSEVKLTVNVQVKCVDVKTQKALFKRTVSEFSLIEANAGLDEREAAINEALDLIGEQIIDLTLGAW